MGKILSKTSLNYIKNKTDKLRFWETCDYELYERKIKSARCTRCDSWWPHGVANAE